MESTAGVSSRAAVTVLSKAPTYQRKRYLGFLDVMEIVMMVLGRYLLFENLDP